MTSISEIPWMIEGGAVHSVQVARNLAYMAAGGTEGIVLGADLEVRETDTPSTSIRVFPGTAAVKNRAAGAFEEMYVFRLGSETEVAIAPTDAGGGRSDLIVARIENPYAAGETWPDPADPTVGPYASLAVISNVGAGVNGVDDLGLSEDKTMLALARIDIPASTVVIDQSMIVDLRVMANAVNQREFKIVPPTATDGLTSGTYVNWPAEAEILVDIPDWATHARLRAILAGVSHGGSGTTNVTGDLRFKIGGSSADITSTSTRYNLDDNGGGPERDVLMVGAPKCDLPREDRGRKGVSVRLEGKKNSGDTHIEVDDRSTISIEVEFVNVPETNV